MSGLSSFHESTISFVAATVESWYARLWKVSVTGPSEEPLSVDSPPPSAHPPSSTTAAAAPMPSNAFRIMACLLVL